MGEADPVQTETLFYGNITVTAGAIVPATSRQRGFGVLTESAPGVYIITLAAGRGVDNIQTQLTITKAEIVNDSQYFWDKAASTDTVKTIRCVNAAGVAVDNVDFTVTLEAILTP